jgi:hypothetical protein
MQLEGRGGGIHTNTTKCSKVDQIEYDVLNEAGISLVQLRKVACFCARPGQTQLIVAVCRAVTRPTA